MHLVDIDFLSNGEGKNVYGGRLDAYSFFETTCELWFEKFSKEVINSIGKRYYPVYRMADGELRFMFGAKINWHNRTFRSILSYLKYEVIKFPWKSSWGEKYKTKKLSELRKSLQKYINEISKAGKIALYWNENGLNAFTEYNNSMISLFESINVFLNKENYVPFHFGQALIARKPVELLNGRNILIVSSIYEDEFKNLKNKLDAFGAKNAEIFRCSSTSALNEDYSKINPQFNPDLILVAAGIGSAKILISLQHFNCPIIDIGSYIHVISGRSLKAHAGFFLAPNIEKDTL